MKKLLILIIAAVAALMPARATNILGQPQITAEQAYQYIMSVHPTANFTREMAQAYINIGKKMGIRGDIAICQSIWETSWFLYTGGTAVTPSDHNYCGLGVTVKGEKGCQFSTVEEGVTAQLIHLWGYATTAALPSGFSSSQDPRWSSLVSAGKRGCSPTWEGLGSGHWATAANYGNNIIGTWTKMKAYEYVEPNPPTIKASKTSLTITAQQNSTPVQYPVTITAANQTEALNIVPNAKIIVATKGANWDNYKGGTLNISIDTSRDPGSYTGGWVKVRAGSATDSQHQVQIDLAITITAPPTPPAGDDFNSTVSADKFKGVWESSARAGLKDWHEIASAQNYARDIAYGNGKLYVAHCKAYGTPSVAVLDAYTGAKSKDLSVKGISGGMFALSAVYFFDGKLIGCNIAAGASDTFTIYKWDSDNADATIIRQDTKGANLDGGATAIGGSIYATGTWTSGKIWCVTNGATTVQVYPVTDGTVGNPQTITLKDAKGATLAFKDADGRGAAGIHVESDGTFWVNGAFGYPIHYAADGSCIEAMNSGALASNYYGTGIAVKPFGSKTYLGAVTYTSGVNNGKMALVDVTDGIAKATAPVTVVPAAGLGAASNAQRLSRVLLATDRKDGHTLDAWVSVPLQGIAHFSYDGDSTVGVSDIAADGSDADAPVEYYNLSGVRVDNPSPGLYIRRQGTRTQKVIIR